MKANPRSHYLPVVMIPAIMPAVLMPAMRNHVPDSLMFGFMGVSLGLALVGLVWMISGGQSSAGDE